MFTSLVGVASGNLLLSQHASATTVESLSLEALVARSARCTVGTPVHFESAWAYIGGAKRIVTLTRVVQEDDLLSPDAGRDEILVMSLGGKVDGLRQKVPGEVALTMGQKALLFVSPEGADNARRVVGMAQGHYSVSLLEGTETLTRSRQLPLLVVRSPRSARPTPSAAATLHGKSLASARALIEKAR